MKWRNSNQNFVESSFYITSKPSSNANLLAISTASPFVTYSFEYKFYQKVHPDQFL
jgi:hypothetical protein